MSRVGFVSKHVRDPQDRPAGGVSAGIGFTIQWQNGPLGQGAERKAPNGAFVEDVIAACMDRLIEYQRSEFACGENKLAIDSLQRALDSLEDRTKRRVASGVEGTHAR